MSLIDISSPGQHRPPDAHDDDDAPPSSTRGEGGRGSAGAGGGRGGASSSSSKQRRPVPVPRPRRNAADGATTAVATADAEQDEEEAFWRRIDDIVTSPPPPAPPPPKTRTAPPHTRSAWVGERVVRFVEACERGFDRHLSDDAGALSAVVSHLLHSRLLSTPSRRDRALRAVFELVFSARSTLRSLLVCYEIVLAYSDGEGGGGAGEGAGEGEGGRDEQDDEDDEEDESAEEGEGDGVKLGEATDAADASGTSQEEHRQRRRAARRAAKAELAEQTRREHVFRLLRGGDGATTRRRDAAGGAEVMVVGGGGGGGVGAGDRARDLIPRLVHLVWAGHYAAALTATATTSTSSSSSSGAASRASDGGDDAVLQAEYEAYLRDQHRRAAEAHAAGHARRAGAGGVTTASSVDATSAPLLLGDSHGGGVSALERDKAVQLRLRETAVRMLYEVCRVRKMRGSDLRCIDERLVEHLFYLVEQTRSHHDEGFNYQLIKLIVALNEQFMIYTLSASASGGRPPPGGPARNTVLRVLQSRLNSSKTFGENLIFMLNRASSSDAEDLCMQLLILKLLYLLFTNGDTAHYFYTNDLRVLVDVFVRELEDLPDESESLRHTYLRVLHPLLTNTQLCTYPYKRPQIRRLLLGMLSHAHLREVTPTTRRLVERCLRAEWCVELDRLDPELARRMGVTLSEAPPPPATRKGAGGGAAAGAGAGGKVEAGEGVGAGHGRAQAVADSKAVLVPVAGGEADVVTVETRVTAEGHRVIRRPMSHEKDATALAVAEAPAVERDQAEGEGENEGDDGDRAIASPDPSNLHESGMESPTSDHHGAVHGRMSAPRLEGSRSASGLLTGAPPAPTGRWPADVAAERGPPPRSFSARSAPPTPPPPPSLLHNQHARSSSPAYRGGVVEGHHVGLRRASATATQTPTSYASHALAPAEAQGGAGESSATHLSASWHGADASKGVGATEAAAAAASTTRRAAPPRPPRHRANSQPREADRPRSAAATTAASGAHHRAGVESGARGPRSLEAAPGGATRSYDGVPVSSAGAGASSPSLRPDAHRHPYLSSSSASSTYHDGGGGGGGATFRAHHYGPSPLAFDSTSALLSAATATDDGVAMHLAAASASSEDVANVTVPVSPSSSPSSSTWRRGGRDAREAQRRDEGAAAAAAGGSVEPTATTWRAPGQTRSELLPPRLHVEAAASEDDGGDEPAAAPTRPRRRSASRAASPTLSSSSSSLYSSRPATPSAGFGSGGGGGGGVYAHSDDNEGAVASVRTLQATEMKRRGPPQRRKPPAPPPLQQQQQQQRSASPRAAAHEAAVEVAEERGSTRRSYHGHDHDRHASLSPRSAEATPTMTAAGAAEEGEERPSGRRRPMQTSASAPHVALGDESGRTGRGANERGVGAGTSQPTAAETPGGATHGWTHAAAAPERAAVASEDADVRTPATSSSAAAAMERSGTEATMAKGSTSPAPAAGVGSSSGSGSALRRRPPPPPPSQAATGSAATAPQVTTPTDGSSR